MRERGRGKRAKYMEMKMVNVLFGLMATTIIFSCLVAQGQQQCMKELGFCISYLNNTSQPPNSCCQPLDYIVKSLPECFCNLISLLGVNGVKPTAFDAGKAQTLPERCGQRINNPLQCITGTDDVGSNKSAPSSANSGLWDSSYVITMAASSIILSFHAL